MQTLEQLKARIHDILIMNSMRANQVKLNKANPDHLDPIYQTTCDVQLQEMQRLQDTLLPIVREIDVPS